MVRFSRFRLIGLTKALDLSLSSIFLLKAAILVGFMIPRGFFVFATKLAISLLDKFDTISNTFHLLFHALHEQAKLCLAIAFGIIG